MHEWIINFGMSLGLTVEGAVLLMYLLPIIIGMGVVTWDKVTEAISRKREVENMAGRKIPWRIFLNAMEKADARPLTEDEVRWIKARVGIKRESQK